MNPSTASAWMLENGIALRTAAPDDLEFLYEVYASTRMDELAHLNWTTDETETFLCQQFHAQHAYYHDQYRDAAFDLILKDGHPVGRLYVARQEKEIRIIDISLLPEHRGNGIGGALLRKILAAAEATVKKVSIHVEQNNPALHLYERLGFERKGEVGVYFFMERPVSGQTDEIAVKQRI